MDTKNIVSNFLTDGDKDQKLINAISFHDPIKDVEQKTFIILYEVDSDNEENSIFDHVFTICTGRTSAYNDIKEKLLSGVNINIHKSIIITETRQTETKTASEKYFLMNLDKCISVYSFCIAVSDSYSDDSFNIEDYNDAQYSISEEFDSVSLTDEQQEYKRLIGNSNWHNINSYSNNTEDV